MLELSALFLWSFLAATVLPLGSEPALAAFAARNETIVLPVMVATAGNYLGACTTYWIARVAVERFASRAEGSSRAARAAQVVQRYGGPALLLSWVPLIGDAIVAAAGAARMRFLPFSVYAVIGKFLRYLVIAMIAKGFF